MGRYFDLLATNDSDQEAEAADLAAPKSPAKAYAVHQSAADGAQLDAGNSPEEGVVETTDKGYTVCTDPADEETCTEYADIKVTSGRVSSFTVNAKSIDGRLSLGQGDRVRIGKLGTAEFISAYKAASTEALWVNLVIRSKGRSLDLNNLYSARYREPGGRQVTATNADTIAELDKESTTRVAVIFAKAKPGGVVTLQLSDTKTYEPATAKIRI